MLSCCTSVLSKPAPNKRTIPATACIRFTGDVYIKTSNNPSSGITCPNPCAKTEVGGATLATVIEAASN